MSTGRQHKQYLARAHAMGGSTTVDAAPYAKLIRDTHAQMSYCAMGRHLGVSHSYLRSVAVGKIKRIGIESAETLSALSKKHTPVDTSHVNSLGTMRRLQALHALGYTWRSLSIETGYSLTGLKSVVYGKWTVIEARNAESVRLAYERLSMRLPTSDDPHGKSAIGAARNSARARGWMPPLAWDDIDRDEAPMTGQHDGHDPVVVDRILAGDMSLARVATKAEKIAVVSRWRAEGRTLNELERLSGWQARRYIEEEVA